MASPDELDENDSTFNPGEVKKYDFESVDCNHWQLYVDQNLQYANQHQNDRVFNDLNKIFYSNQDTCDIYDSHLELSDSGLMSGCSKSLSNKQSSQILEISEDETDQNFQQLSTMEFIEFLESIKNIIQYASKTRNNNGEKSQYEYSNYKLYIFKIELNLIL